MTSNNNGIHTRALLVGLTLSTWSARKYDKKVTQEVNSNHGASSDAGRYNKLLLPGDASSYKRLVTLVQTIRVEHYTRTLAWSDEGWRVLPSVDFMDYTDWYRKRQSELDRAVDDFVTDYPTLKQNAKAKLNGLYKEEDYPAENDIRRRFGVDLSYMPIPAQGDIRLDLDADQVKAIEERVQEKLGDSVTVAMRDVWTRLAKVVDHLATRVKAIDSDGRFHDTAVTHLREMCEAVRSLNITDDTELEDMRARIESSLSNLDPDTLRESEPLRNKVLTETDEILRQMREAYGVAI